MWPLAMGRRRARLNSARPAVETTREWQVGDQELTYDPFVPEEESRVAPADSVGGVGRCRPLERLLRRDHGPTKTTRGSMSSGDMGEMIWRPIELVVPAKRGSMSGDLQWRTAEHREVETAGAREVARRP
jgi:hypothetical protein